MKRAASILFVLALLAPLGALAQDVPPSPFAPQPRRPRPAQVVQAQPEQAQPEEAAAEPAEASPEALPTDEALPVDEALPTEAAELAAPVEAEPVIEAEPVLDMHALEAEPLVADEAAAQEHAGAEHGHGAAHEEGAEHEEAAFNLTEFIATVVNFFIWLAIIIFLMRKPLSEFLKNRRTAVVEGLEESKRLKAAAEQKYAEYSERLEHLDEELEKLRREMIQAGEAERDRIIAEAEARAARMRKDAQFVIDQQMKQLKSDLTREAIEAAVAAAEAVLTKETGAADQQRLAEAYLGKLEKSVKDGEVRA